MNKPITRSTARRIAAGYVGVVTLAAVAYEFAGRPEYGVGAMTLAAWPGDVLLLVFVLYPLALLTGDASGVEEAGFSLLNPLYQGAGAVVNVLILWGAITLVRHFRTECRRSQSS
ncbi:hypothetical protein ACIOD0_17030 [Kitasatospora albolonga]